MSDSLDVGEVTALLFDERRYSSDVRPKAFHKILYFAKQELDRERVDEDIDIYWYMWGAMASTAGSPIEFRDGHEGQRVTCGTRVGDIEASETTIQRGRRAVSRALDRYYDLGIEGLTDEMYAEAPYAVQRHFRELDKQLDSASDSEQMTLTLDRNEEMTRSTLHNLVQSFPLDEFPAYEDDLHIWYRLMSAELDSDDYDPEAAERLARLFWRLFCLELACRHGSMSRAEIEAELGVDNLDAAKADLRDRLRQMEREKARRNSRDSSAAMEAADAFVVPFVVGDVRP
jgi:hypothetical protein